MPVTSVLKDYRVPNKAGLVLGRIVFDELSEFQDVLFEALAGEDALARINAMIQSRQDERKAREISRNVADATANGSLATPRFVLSTMLENFAALRLAYQDATKLDAIMMGDFLSTLTDAQLRTAFSFTQNQVNTLRTNKLTPAASAAATIRASSGA